MTKKNDNIIFWIVGIVLFLLVAPQLPFFHGGFAIITTQTCAEGVTNYYPLDGNLLDQKEGAYLTNHGATFTTGKVNQGILFDTTNYVSFPSINLNLSVGMWINNYSNSNGWYYALDTGIPLSTQFGLGFNGSVDEVVIGTNISGLSNIQPCYQTTTYENVTCTEYFDNTLTDTGGCINPTGTLFPNCSYVRENTTTYKIENNLCKKNFYCQSSCLVSGHCYLTNQSCIESLIYDCYVLSNNICSLKTDYTSCKVNTTNTYLTLSACNYQVQNTTAPSTTSTPTPFVSTAPPEKTWIENLTTKELFSLFGVSVTAIYLIIALLIIIGLLYFLGAFK